MSELLVTQSLKDAKDRDKVFPVEDCLENVSQKTMINLWNSVSGLDVASPRVLPYQVIVWRLCKSGTPNLLTSIVIHEELSKTVSKRERDISAITCDQDLNKVYCRVAQDVADKHGVEHRCIRASFTRSKIQFMVSYFILLGKLLLLFLDKFVSLFIPLSDDTQQNHDVVFIPAANRLDSSLPVLREFERQPLVTVTLPTLYHLNNRNKYRDLDEFNPQILNKYITPRSFLDQLKTAFFTLNYELMYRGDLFKELTAELESEFDARLPKTTRYLLQDRVYNLRVVRALLIRRSLRTLMKKVEPGKVVVGTMDPVGRSIVLESLEKDAKVYFIPHSIATPYPPNPPRPTDQFLSGRLDQHYYEEMVPDKLAWRWIPLGRPYLADFKKRYSSRKDRLGKRGNGKDGVSVLIATQPFSTKVRQELVGTLTGVLNEAHPDTRITIKTHPDEDPSIYDNFRRKHPNLSVTTEALFENILASDVVFTINSNVGLESVVLGTPCVCVNMWEPFHLDPTYSFQGEIPVLRSEEELFEFCDELNSSTLQDLGQRQTDWLKENYVLDHDSAEKIKDYIVKS